jgi:hypothetical protein
MIFAGTYIVYNEIPAVRNGGLLASTIAFITFVTLIGLQ